MKMNIRCYPILIISVFFTSSVFAAIPDCGKLPDYVREFDRNMRVCVKNANMCGTGKDKIVTQVFSNNEGKLPKLKSPFSYVEGKYFEQGQFDKYNKFRLVVKVDGGNNFSERYYTSDHYITFCKLP
ncbi:hypothetical protein F889_00638 [Acinetobacter colistiniresistens]|uniref:Uncharacterized protein n=1 Tax=Acinetobacter colistiniresistens TaxID=280145 RepID=N9PQU2_9GAMM|nr:ribonuclease domain-containing protein [Acinetobacter colistiniresistens]ENX35939.1 hypothetical protein F889_00638 [Acinetobacter colistiniresistens]